LRDAGPAQEPGGGRPSRIHRSRPSASRRRRPCRRRPVRRRPYGRDRFETGQGGGRESRVLGAGRGGATPGRRRCGDRGPRTAPPIARRRVPGGDGPCSRGIVGRDRQGSQEHIDRSARMTVLADLAHTRARPGAAQMARWAISDALVMTRRNLLVWLRVPAYIVFTVVQPIIFVLLFRYVFGGAIQAPGAGGYVSYLMPGIIAQTAAFATFATAIALAQEATKGVIDRFRAMPMARSAVLAGRLIADSIRMLIVILVIIGVGYAVGFRFENGVGGAVGMVLLAEAFGIAVCSVSAFVGLAIKDEESV